jgi:STE24 endopeptidase
MHIQDNSTENNQQFESPENRAREYNRKKLAVRFIILFLSVFVLWGIVGTGAHQDAILQIGKLTSNYYFRFLLLTAWIGGIILFFEIPFKIYGEYVLEQIYELSNQTFWEYVKEKLKAFAVGIAIGIPVLFLFSYLFRNYQNWWLYFAMILFFYTILLSILLPSVILPIFFNLTPIRDDQLKEKLKNISQKAGFHISGVYEFDLSRESKKANAALVGIGKTKRVILSDTLLHAFQMDEIAAIFAHECGHYRKKHIWKSIVLNFLIMLVGFKIVHKIFLVNATGPSYDLTNLPFLFLLIQWMEIFILPFQNMISRKFEYEADRESVRLMEDKKPLISALKKLASMNLIDVSPGKFVEWYFYTHPSMEKRLQALQK